MIARVISIVAAVLATLIALPLLWSGGGQFLFHFSVALGGPPPVLALLTWAAGVIFLAIACATVVFSSAGILVTGVAHLLVGLASIVLTISPFSPVVLLGRLFVDIEPNALRGQAAFLVGGIAIALGTIQIVTGIMVRRRRRRPSAGLSVLAAVGAGLVLTIGILLELWWGADVIRASLQRFQSDLVATLLCLVAMLVIAAATIPVRWSGAVLVIPGVLVGGLTIVALAAPRLVFDLGALNLTDAVYALQAPALAVALIVLGLGSAWRARRQYADEDETVDTGVVAAQVAAHAGEASTFPDEPRVAGA